jgi:RNA polymerase sigma-70 factor (ECF subfamily)
VPSHRPADEARFEELLTRYRRALRAAIARVISPRTGISTDDVEQEASLRLWRALSDGRTLDNPGAYVYRVGMAAAIDAVRALKARREQELDEDDLRTLTAPEPTPERAIGGRQLLERAAVVLTGLPDDHRRVVGLSLSGFARREIVDMTGWSETRVRNLLHRGLKDLRRGCKERGIAL